MKAQLSTQVALKTVFYIFLNIIDCATCETEIIHNPSPGLAFQDKVSNKLFLDGLNE